ncbi:MAG: hypothetical protein M9891_08790 [Austwickia sp.]|nr:hypothetical protein [Actinomycetota bacterium]MCO5309371.1 hypothetical protein [Austwickia sp.]
MTVPKTYTQDSAVLKLECDNKVTRTATVRTATAAKPAQKAPTATNTPARVLPKGGAQTGGGAPISDQGSTVPLVLGGVGALGLVGAGAVALRRRAEARG